MLVNSLRSLSFTITLLSISFGLSSIATAGNYDRIDRVAVRIQKNSQRLLEETTSYRRLPEYRGLVQDTCLLRDTALHIHDVTHFEGNLRQLKQDVALIDQTAYHLKGLIGHIEAQSSYGYGYTNVNTRRARNLLKQIERDVDSLSDELTKITKLVYQPKPQTYYRPTPKPVAKVKTYNSNYKPYSNSYKPYQSGRSYGASPYGSNRNDYNRTAFGFSIGGGSTKIRIGF